MLNVQAPSNYVTGAFMMLEQMPEGHIAKVSRRLASFDPQGRNRLQRAARNVTYPYALKRANARRAYCAPSFLRSDSDYKNESTLGLRGAPRRVLLEYFLIYYTPHSIFFLKKFLGICNSFARIKPCAHWALAIFFCVCIIATTVHRSKEKRPRSLRTRVCPVPNTSNENSVI